MFDSIRAEFPGLASLGERIRAPRIAREPIWWAFLSGVGAGFIAGAVVLVILHFVSPLLFPNTEPRPSWFGPNFVTQLVSSLAVGAVATTAGGLRAAGLYVIYELALLLTRLPGRMLFCERSGGPGPNLLDLQGCDYPALVLEHWPTWLGLLCGVLIARLLRARAGAANWTLRAAGAYGVTISVASAAFGLFFGTRAGSLDEQFTLSNLFAVCQLLAAIVGGVLLARTTLPGAAIVALGILAPLVFSLQLAMQEAAPNEPLEWTLMRWSSVYLPVLSAVTLLISRGYVRQRTTGTFF